MSKRMKKTGRLFLWLSVLGIGGVTGSLLVNANKTGQRIVTNSDQSDPTTTGSNRSESHEVVWRSGLVPVN